MALEMIHGTKGGIVTCFQSVYLDGWWVHEEMQKNREYGENVPANSFFDSETKNKWVTKMRFAMFFVLT